MEKNTTLAEDNKDLQLEVLSLLGQLQDRNELTSKIKELEEKIVLLKVKHEGGIYQEND